MISFKPSIPPKFSYDIKYYFKNFVVVKATIFIFLIQFYFFPPFQKKPPRVSIGAVPYPKTDQSVFCLF